MDFQLEICANSIQSALAAQAGGATRIELCDNMTEGGTTPSYGMISLCKKLLQIPVFPIIRPRGGDFLYTDEEFEVMKQDVIACRNLGCDGVVLGILNADGSIDTERCAQLIALARPMQVTFHRAFDRCNDLEKGLEVIIALGCERVLTSGGKRYAVDAILILKQLVQQATGRIHILIGSGVNTENIALLAKETGATEFHSTAKISWASKMIYRPDNELGQADLNTAIQESSEELVRKMRQELGF
ncbi:MAG TPA: copper homeostasis protein CutC [Daejeonella sp.]|nr:copper homeostasis protein CutC [Daejeonella sp.]